MFQCRRVNDWFKGRTGLPQGLNGAVEFAFLKSVTPNHGLDFTGFIVNRQNGAFDCRFLLQAQFKLLFLPVYSQYSKEGDIA
jgi:hypothetical protein